MARIPDDRFRVFVSHKHEDHELAIRVKQALEELCGTIECFVSGSSIGAGTDWNREIRQALARSHLLILLFTNPTRNWDWCLYEAGLYTRFGEDHVRSVVSIFHPKGEAPRPLSNLQGLPAAPEMVADFLSRLCRETWHVSDDWLRGPLKRVVRDDQIRAAATTIAAAFPAPSTAGAVHHPCHRVVLDLSQASPPANGIPEDATVIEGAGATETYTLSLFRAASAGRTRTWRDLVAAVGGEQAAWRHQLDRRFMAALREELFRPGTATLRAFDPEQRQRRYYRPVLYKIVRSPPAAGLDVPTATRSQRPLSLTIVFDPQFVPPQAAVPALDLVRINARFATEVFDAFCGTVVGRSHAGAEVFDEIGDALQVIYDEAERYGLFEMSELERAYGEDYERSGVKALGLTWDGRRRELDAARAACDGRAVERILAEMRELNRAFSLAATRRYLTALETARERPAGT
jgi:hypothetical protein